MSTFVPNNVYLGGILLHTLFKTNLQLKHKEFLLRLMVTILCQIRHAETGFDASKIMIFNLRIKNAVAHRKNLKTKNGGHARWRQISDASRTWKNITGWWVSCFKMFIKVLGMIQKQGHWMPYELKPRDVERRFVTCELLLQRQKRKRFLHRIVTGDEKWIHYDNLKRRKSWDHASTSSAKPNIHCSKLIL